MYLQLTQEHAVVHMHTRQLHSTYKFDAFKDDNPYKFQLLTEDSIQLR